jgi:hypothetical protein
MKTRNPTNETLNRLEPEKKLLGSNRTEPEKKIKTRTRPCKPENPASLILPKIHKNSDKISQILPRNLFLFIYSFLND